MSQNPKPVETDDYDLVVPPNLGLSLFGAWNAIFLAFMVLGFAPLMIPELFMQFQQGILQFRFLALAIILVLIPIAVVVLARVYLRNSPNRMFAFGYVVEGPLMALVLLRFFAIREGTFVIHLLLVTGLIGILIFAWQVFDRRIDRRGLALQIVRLVGLSLLFLLAIYIAIWLLFYVAPLAVGLFQLLENLFRTIVESFRSIGQGDAWMYLRYLPLNIMGLILLGFTGTLVILLPVVAPILTGKAWLRAVRAVTVRTGRATGIAAAAAPVVLMIALVALGMRQPQHQAFALLKTPPGTIEEARALLERKDEIRTGLLNAYLAPFRYISAVGEVRHVRNMYEWAFGMQPETAQKIEAAYEVVTRPLLYVPVTPRQDELDNLTFQRETGEAAELYEQFFDQPINQGERQEVVRAVRSTWSGEQAEAAWQSIDDREVLLTTQEITVQEHGDWAEVELYEVYQNQTSERQEVVYYFSLPESAVISGLWLGNSADRNARFEYRVSPRGAAQGIYRNELIRQVDPALVEQIGPRQYRLRAFPIEPKRIRWEGQGQRTMTVVQPELHLWMTYRVMAQDAAWPMPALAEVRNVYWDASTARKVNGETVRPGDDWLPDSIAAAGDTTPMTHRVDFPGGQTVMAYPVDEASLPSINRPLNLAVVLDRSFSMTGHADAVEQALAELQAALPEGSRAVAYLTSSPYRGEAPGRVGLASLDPDSIVYFGGQNAGELLAQYLELSQGEQVDAVIVLTDSTGYELGEANADLGVPSAPVWVVHVDGQLALGYDDGTLEAIQASGGGVAASVTEALARLAVGLNAGGMPSASFPGAYTDFVDGYAWVTMPEESAMLLSFAGSPGDSAADPFTAVAARRVILSEMLKNHADLESLDALDALHALAVENSVVTPYSSMIVLVDSRQHSMLDELERRGDRYNREVEAVGDTIAANPFAVTGVPEPEEWLLIGVAVAMLAYFVWKRRPAGAVPRSLSL